MDLRDNYETEYNYLTQEQKGIRKITFNKTIDNEEFTFFSLDVEYDEVRFNENLVNPIEELAPDGPLKNILLPYKQNAVKSFVFKKRPICLENVDKCKNFYIGILIEINALDLDFEKGDYLVIGSGLRPSFRLDSKSQVLSQKIEKVEEKRQVWVQADSAFMK